MALSVDNRKAGSRLMKKLSLILIILLTFSILLSSFPSLVFASTYPTPPAITLRSTNIGSSNNYYCSQRRNIYATGLWWTLYWFYQATPESKYFYVYQTSSDAETWSGETEILSFYSGDAGGIAVAFDETNFHVVIKNGTYPYHLIYSLGTPQSNGTIAWLTDWQTITDSNTTPSVPNIFLDKDSKPWIYYRNETGVPWSYSQVIDHSIYSNGTWQSEGGIFPYELTASFNYVSNNVFDHGIGNMVTHDDGTVQWLYSIPDIPTQNNNLTSALFNDTTFISSFYMDFHVSYYAFDTVVKVSESRAFQIAVDGGNTWLIEFNKTAVVQKQIMIDHYTNGGIAYKSDRNLLIMIGGSLYPDQHSLIFRAYNLTSDTLGSVYTLLENAIPSLERTENINVASSENDGKILITFLGIDESSLRVTYFSWKDYFQEGLDYPYTDEAIVTSCEVKQNVGFLTRHHPSNNTGSSGRSQSFRTVSGNDTLTKVAFDIYKGNNPTANVTANLYLKDSSSNKPTGSVLTSSIPINSSTLPSPTDAWVNFTFTSSYVLLSNTWYVITIETSAEGTIDDTNLVALWLTSSDAIEGARCSYASSQWNEQSSGYDLDFRIYGVIATSIVVFYRDISGGSFLVNGTSKYFGNSTAYPTGSILNLTAVPLIHYSFINFSWDGSSSNSNPYYLTVTSNLTIWCYFHIKPFVTFYKDDGVFSVDGSPTANGTVIEEPYGATLILAGSGFTKYYGFGNWTFSYSGSSEGNPYSHVVSHDANYSIWLYHKWSPSEWSPDFPTTPAALVDLVNGDYLSFINSMFTSQLGELFYAFIMLVCYVGLYLRLKSIVIPLIAWTLMGGFWIGMAPSVSPFVALFWIIGIGGGVLFSVFSRGSEN